MGQFGIGQGVRRLEDPRLLTGAGRYTDDLHVPGQVRAYFLRSPHAHARIRAIDTAAARAAPGVLAVYTSEDVKAAGLGTIPCLVPLKQMDGKPLVTPPRPLLAEALVHHVGEAVAMVVAETIDAARDAAELIDIDYEDLPVIVDTATAITADVPHVWPQAPGNICFRWEKGDRAGTDAAFEKAARVVKKRIVNNRIIVNPLEPRAALGEWDGQRFTLQTPSQGPHLLQEQLAEHVFKLPKDRFRVVTPDVGGSFGTKIFLYPEHALVLFAARALNRPVKWTGERSTDDFVSDTQGRDHVADAELALDADGRFLALRVRTIANLGAFLSNFAPFIPTDLYAVMLPGVYTFAAVHVEVTGVFTHTAPVDAYRGAGRPEAAHLLERMVDAAAREIGLGPVELRRRNFVSSQAMPYRTAMGLDYDSGEFARTMDMALARADWKGFPNRARAARAKGRLRGIGLAYYIEACGGDPEEGAEVSVDTEGNVEVLIGSQSNGQGHETALAQVVADRLGVAIERVRVVQGDTDLIATGSGTGGSRGLPVGGVACAQAADAVIEKGRRIAAEVLEAATADIRFVDGIFEVAGTDRRLALPEVAAAAHESRYLAEGEPPGLSAAETFSPKARTFPNGCHICELEIDPETGTAEILRYTVADDFGTVVNPLLLAGQIHGGVVQGIGQAMIERCVYDEETGQLLSGSFTDYGLPRADNVPFVDLVLNEDVPCKNNPLGIKGAGEAGAVGAPPAVVNAVIDALSDFGITHLDMPITPERIWAALRDNQRTSR
ncbi:MAG: xanthine dehydrogenase family protein molybdopterin-binding subunit [Nitrospira sp.]|nr:xanthine dehydrogenase family protein molybdopterin-binding subunit [Nitrospira sp.]